MMIDSEKELLLDLLRSGSMDSILIDKKDPVTYRLFHKFTDGTRVCLHEMLPGCVPPHPHKYSVRVYVLEGGYRHHICVPTDGYLKHVFTHDVISGSNYIISDPEVYHALEIKERTYSIMFNDHYFPSPSKDCKTVEDKGFSKIPESKKKELEDYFIQLIAGNFE